jgi:hypothetical protein
MSTSSFLDTIFYVLVAPVSQARNDIGRGLEPVVPKVVTETGERPGQENNYEIT